LAARLSAGDILVQVGDIIHVAFYMTLLLVRVEVIKNKAAVLQDLFR
jgi:hypothetical protein